MAPLDTLLRRLLRAVEQTTAGLEADPDRVDAWHAEMRRLLTRGHTAAMMAGTGRRDLTPAERAAVTKDVRVQLKFLDDFRVEIANSNRQWRRGWNARAKMYAESIKIPYWRGRVKMLPLPAMPAEGTNCRGRCGCSWDVVTVDEAAGDYDAFWRRGKSDSCQICVERESQWSPVRIRGGELV